MANSIALRIVGMTCESCAEHVEQALENVPGVRSTAVSYPKGWAAIKADAGVKVETLAAVASVVAVLCAVIIAEGLKARGQNEHHSIATSEKAKIYERLLFLCCEQLKRHGNRDEPAADAELVKLEQLLALHGSVKIITAYDKLRRLAKRAGEPGDTAPALLSKLLMEMRGDLGRTEFIRKENDLLDLLLGRG